MAAGVGKTYRMLQEGQPGRAGRDVAIGLLETHGRAETAALAEGLEVVPRAALDHRGTRSTRWTCPASSSARPSSCLVDELAHTNAPGARAPKRYEDVDDLLAPASTCSRRVNVQHLGVLNDRVAELAGVRVRETSPTRCSARPTSRADRPHARGAARPPAGREDLPARARIDAALNNFFRVENLAALREIALRQVAEEVESKRLVTERGDARRRLAERRAAGRRRAAARAGRALPGAQRLVRRAWRSAQRLGAELDLLWVRRPGARSTRTRERC